MARSNKRQAVPRPAVPRHRPTLDGLVGQFQTDAAAFEDRTQDDDKLVAAVGYWTGYPSFFEVIECFPEATSAERCNALASLSQTHLEAVFFLMAEAERLGLDSSPLSEEGRVCREVFAKSELYKPFVREGVHDLWPDCLGPTRYRLPEAMQAAIRDGEAVFARLVVLKGMDLQDLRSRAYTPGMAATPIPPEDRTIPLSYRRAAKLIGKGDCQDAAEWLSKSVADGSIPCEHVSRQTHVFSKRSFPEAVWPEIMPK